ncbi:thioredoxin family protein [Haloferula helveola]|uniref:Thioredoxin family protein n=1 Tax=Haloferula helveola TaxID=490095 RepID=A0ABM7R8Z2_9BACT|nr:thioredoxin family protein [Haloferula helveola]
MKMKSTMTWMAAAIVACGVANAVEPGDTAPGFTLPSVKGEEVSLSDYKGKVVVLEWINFGCPFVKKHYGSGNMPMLQEKYSDDEVVWISVNSSAEGKGGYMPAEKLGERAEKEGSKADQIVLDTDGKVGKAYGAKTTPHMFVIGKDGKLAFGGGIDNKPSTKAADVEGATNFVVAAVDALLAGKPVETAKAPPYGCGVKY